MNFGEFFEAATDVAWPCPPKIRQARGVREGDSLPGVALPGVDFTSSLVIAPEVILHLDVMDLGLSTAYGPSWRERTGALLATHGSFRLAWYEAVLRIADQRASRLAESKPFGDVLKHELDREDPHLAEATARDAATVALGTHSTKRGSKHGLRGRTGEP
jgi:hypothetical protein